MRDLKRYLFYILLLELSVLVGGRVITGLENLTITFINIALLSVGFLSINLVCLLIFFKGRKGDEDSQAKSLLISFTVKFLAELVLAFFWFFGAKKSTVESLLLFFILYLAFTLFTMWASLKTLKHRTL